MNKIIFLSLLTILTFAQSYAQVDTMQDRPDLKWSKLEDEKFKIVFPDSQKEQAQFILNLVNYYQAPVNESYGADLRKWTLVMRTERAKPNGFVTLMPRRSEWFSHAGITPIISSLEWNQSLAIHEYRHMVQYDYFKRDNLHYGYYLFGELGQAALMAISAPQWYFEGDAVWAETTLSNAGRGRSPRFSARMKALMLNNELPTYDELLGGVYTTKLPNHYLYGYFLITRAYNIYGKDVWREIIAKAAKSPINPYTFYNAFRFVTGKDFIEFYEETIAELNKKWGEAKLSSNQIYTEYEQPIKTDHGLFYLKKDLDSFWTLYKDNQKIKELNIIPRLSKTDLKRSKFVYPQFLPHYRYGYKDYSDLFMLDVNTGVEKQITHNRRMFHPSIHPTQDKIMAVEFKDKFVLSIFDFNGNKLKEISLKDKIVAEAIWYKDHAIAIVLDKQGMKSIGKIDLNTSSFVPMQKANRNNIYGLRLNSDKVFFEADDQGIVNVHGMDVKSAKLYKCSNELIAAFNPYASGKDLYYVSEIANGQSIKKSSIDCKATGPLYKDYLGDSPSTDFHKSPPVSVENFEKLYENKTVKEDYFELDNALTPHSWNFIGGRGTQIGVSTQNYLNTISINAALGEGVNEDGFFGNLALNYKKYYPIFSLLLDYQDRANEIDQWSESSVGAGIILPYTYRSGLFDGNHSLSLIANKLEVSNRKTQRIYELDSEQLLLKRIVFNTSFLKEKRFRELRPSKGVNFEAQYVDATAEEDKTFSNYLGYAKLDLLAPGLKTNHGFLLTLSAEYRKDDPFTYRIISPAESINEYAFSKGFDFEYVGNWQKASLNYIMPISYPNKSYGRWIYFNRIYTNLYIDHTHTSTPRSLNSLGAELFFESLTLRKIPLTYGLRYINRLNHGNSRAELFFNLDVAY